MTRKMMWFDSAPTTVRLRIVGRDAKFACPGVMAKVHVEGTILLTGNNHMLDGSERGLPATCIKRQTHSRKHTELAQYLASRLPLIKKLLQIHKGSKTSPSFSFAGEAINYRKYSNP